MPRFFSNNLFRDKQEVYLLEQLKKWDLAKSNYEALKQVETKELNVNGAKFIVQFNPARIVSSGAKVDAKSIRDRACFLCEENRPKLQKGLDFGEHYTILINPFPIFPKHFTIVDVKHVPQLIAGRFGDMLDLAEYMDDYVIFYNGPKCGASAPDHAHFQAGNRGFLPIEKGWKNHIVVKKDENLSLINYGFPAFVIEALSKKRCICLFEKIYEALPVKEGDTEPKMNILTWCEAKHFTAVIIPRAKHRPDCFFAKGDENILISPASVDLGGVFITPLEKDFEKITIKNVAKVLKEVCLSEKEYYDIIKNLAG